MTVIYCHHAVSRGTLDSGRTVRPGGAGTGARGVGAARWASARSAGSPDPALLHDARPARSSGGDARADRLLWKQASLATARDQAIAGARTDAGADSASAARFERRGAAPSGGS